MHQRGVVSIWVGWLRSKKQLSGYLEELYWDDESHRSRFASDFELYDYDDYAMEAQFAIEGGLLALLRDASFAASFRDRALARLSELGVQDPSTLIILYDFEFVPNGESKKKKDPKRELIFLGVFPYVHPERAS